MVLAATAGVFYACTRQQPAQAPEKRLAEKLLTQIDSFSAICTRLQRAVETGETDTAVLRRLFLQTRLGYKRIEWAAEYFDPTAARIVNGPPVPEVELSGKVFDPAGLQVMEAFLWPRYDTVRRQDLVSQLRRILAACTQYKRHFANIDILDWQVFDATKLEVFRIETEGIVGFDDPLSQKSMAEAAESLRGMQEILAGYLRGKAAATDPATKAANADPATKAATAAADSLARLFDAAAHYLMDHPDFNSFDRAAFITGYANLLTTDLTGLDQRLPVQHIRYNRLLNQEAKTLFDTNAFNVNAYVPNYVSFTSPEKIALGRKLFSDASLSATGTRSCQSCHQPDKAFTDGLVKNTMLENHQLLARNTPTLLNAALQPSQFYDLRVKTLEDQSRNVVQNEAEMHGDMQLSVQRLWKDTVYRRLFTTAFPRKERMGIDTLEVMNAIGSYVRSLVFLNSRFDSYMRGDKTALTPAEVDGFNLFMGKAKCGSCHYMPSVQRHLPAAVYADRNGSHRRPRHGRRQDYRRRPWPLCHRKGGILPACLQDTHRPQCCADGAVYAQWSVCQPGAGGGFL